MIDLNDIAIFTKVVEARSFTGGSRLLDMPKATVSRKVSDLEKHLGVRLLERTTRKLRLTEAGERFYQRCNQHVVSLEQASELAHEIQTEPQGLLRLSLPSSGNHMIAELLAEFMALYPKIQLSVTMTTTPLDLLEHNIDIALRVGVLKDSSLVARKLSPIQSYLVAAPSYLQRKGLPRTPADLAQHDFVRINNGIATRSEIELLGPMGKEVISMSGRLEGNTLDFVLYSTIAGSGIAHLPSFAIVNYVKQGQLNVLLTDYTLQMGDIYLVYPSRQHIASKVRVFVDFMIQQTHPQPPWIIDPKHLLEAT